MPKVEREKFLRVGIRLPAPLIEEVDRIIDEFPEYAWNRQKFIEEAIREKMMKLSPPESHTRSKGKPVDCKKEMNSMPRRVVNHSTNRSKLPRASELSDLELLQLLADHLKSTDRSDSSVDRPVRNT